MVDVVHDGKRYVLKGHRGEGSFGDLLKWQMEGKRARWPRRVENPGHAPPPQRVEGAALKEQLARMLRHSNNYIADLITLNVSVSLGRKPGPLADASLALTDFVAKARGSNSPSARPTLFSGSGLTPESRLSAQDLVSVLQYQYRDSRRFPAFYGGLVVPREGPYAFLRRGGSDAWLDRVALKTGTLTEPISVNSMAGYLRKKSGGWMAFAVLVNGSQTRRVIPFGTAVDAIRGDLDAILKRY